MSLCFLGLGVARACSSATYNYYPPYNITSVSYFVPSFSVPSPSPCRLGLLFRLLSCLLGGRPAWSSQVWRRHSHPAPACFVSPSNACICYFCFHSQAVLNALRPAWGCVVGFGGVCLSTCCWGVDARWQVPAAAVGGWCFPLVSGGVLACAAALAGV